MLRSTFDRAGIVLFLSATPWQRPTSLRRSFFGTVTSMKFLVSYIESGRFANPTP
jgi:hypothetical protein